MALTYKDLIFTEHARHRLQERHLTADAIWQVIHYPDQRQAKEADQTKFVKLVKQRKVQVIAKYLEQEKNWLVISVWVRGEEDRIPLVWRLLTLPVKLVSKLFKP